MWGSSYLFIKLAVDDFGTFTLVALRLIGRRDPALDRRPIAGQALPRERRIYGHLLVMAIINITIPFLLITWAEQSVESSLAAILTSPVPLFAIVLRRSSCPTSRCGSTASSGSSSGSSGSSSSRAPGSPATDRRSPASSPCSGRRSATPCGAVYSRRNVRGLAADDPGRLPGDVRRDHHGTCRARLRAPVDRARRTPRRSSRSSGWASWAPGWRTWPSSACSRTGARRGRRSSPMSSRSVGIVLGYLVLAGADRRPARSSGPAWSSPGVGLVNSRFGRRRLFGRVPADRGGLADARRGRPGRRLSRRPRAAAPRRR